MWKGGMRWGDHWAPGLEYHCELWYKFSRCGPRTGAGRSSTRLPDAPCRAPLADASVDHLGPPGPEHSNKKRETDGGEGEGPVGGGGGCAYLT